MSYDLIIIGSGPAGLTASIYASRYKLKHLVIGKLLGGTITWAHKVENFPGFKEISGFELSQKMAEQAKSLGAEIWSENVQKILVSSGNPSTFKIVTETNKEIESRAVLVATGTERRKLNIPGEKEFLGKGVSYCTTCDAAFFKDKTVVLVGGSNAACSGASHLAQFARKIYLIYRKDELRAEPVWVDEVKNNPKVVIVYNTNVTEIFGNGTKLTGVRLDKPFERKNELEAEGVFIEIGGLPVGFLLAAFGVEMDENGYVKVNEKMETNIRGLFAAGDLTTHGQVMSQAIVAAADGAIAAGSVYKFLKEK